MTEHDSTCATARDVLDLIAEALDERSRSISGSRVGVVGVAPNPGTQVPPSSSAGTVLASLVERGAEVRYHDPQAARFRDDAGYEHTGVGLDALLHWAHVLVIMTGACAADWDHLCESADLVVDTVSSAQGRASRERQVLRLGAGWIVPPASGA
jgi:UDP-N-acetyl-D-mannosaminuronate dehydrogenase